MSPKVTRRRFLAGGAAAGVAVAARSLRAAPAVIVKGEARPTIVGSWNALKFTNGGPRTAIVEAFERLTRGDDVLDALIAGVNIVELDPEDDSVGYGGLPNADGVVQLDASCMHGAKRRAGAVAALEGVRTPSLVARAVMDSTDNHLLAGRGAQDFARRMGFKIEDDLNTEHSRRLWLEWKRRTDPDHYPDPASRAVAGERARREMIAAGLVNAETVWGTIHLHGISARGEIACVTTTSGLEWKIPGRTGDSPILGAGSYVDNAVGAAGSTGRGEANLYNVSSFFIVEQMRQGRHPKDAAIEALTRIRANTVEKRLLNHRGLPNFQLKFYALDRQGRHAGVAMYGGPDVNYAVATGDGAKLLPMEAFLSGSAAD
ncbi:MAG TPA: N(4)-(beta-N-acetylglucosaminyl)-L-asparaginase [Patescibacteria group bacterium]|nr:N(4)-(beta-N-acetylglucosaminyl)-L-asparaginase [Patescibacteria group bacterium]